MQEQKNIIECYNKTARNYADKYLDELSKKHLDRLLLKSFASENFNKGKLIDLGCGPGQTTKYLFDCGLTDLIGVDISQSMVTVAKSIHPMLNFETADILNLKYPDKTFGSAIAFYSIVHFDFMQMEIAFKEIKRVLKDNGEFLFSFHIGDNVVHLDDFLDHQVNIDFYFFDTKKITDLLTKTGFEIIDAIERPPYQGVEYPSKRAYIWAKNY
jgi:ubiquinone/menaquinone biosynthesis C-methylase UbiE